MRLGVQKQRDKYAAIHQLIMCGWITIIQDWEKKKRCVYTFTSEFNPPPSSHKIVSDPSDRYRYDR